MKKLLLSILLAVLAACCVGLVACGEKAPEYYEIEIKSLIPEGVVGEEYDFSECFFAEDGYKYSIRAEYAAEENGKLVSKPVAKVEGLKFVQDVYADVYVTVIAEKGGKTFTSDEAIVKIRRAGDETYDYLNSTEFLYMFMPNGGRVDTLVPVEEGTNTSAGSYKSWRIDYPATGNDVDAEVFLEVRALFSWFNLDLTNATFSIDLYQENRSDTAIFKFESQTSNYYGNFVNVQLGADKSGEGWTCDTIDGKEGWYHIEIECGQANIDKYQIDEYGNVGEPGEEVRVFGVDDIARIRIEVPFEGEEGTASTLILDNCNIENEVVTDVKDKSKYSEILYELNRGIVMNSAVSGGEATVSIVTDETCNSDDALKLTQGSTNSKWPLYWIDLRTLSQTGVSSIDISNSTLKFDVKFEFNGPFNQISIDFLDNKNPQNIGRTAGLWLGNGQEPVISPDDGTGSYTDQGITFEKVEGKDGWWHIEIDIAQAHFDKGDYEESSTGFMRIIASCGETPPPEGTDLLWIDNVRIDENEGELERPEVAYGDVEDGAVTGSEGTVTAVTDETCNSDSALKLEQGNTQTTWPSYIADLKTLSSDGVTSLDLSEAVVEFDIKLLFGTVWQVNIDFLNAENGASKIMGLFLGENNFPTICPGDDSYNDKGVTVTPVEGKEGWYHVKLDLTVAEIASNLFNVKDVASLRISCSLKAPAPAAGTLLAYIDNLKVSEMIPPEEESEPKPGEVATSAVSGEYGTVTVVANETCNSDIALKLEQGAEGTSYPLYKVDLTTLSADGASALDISNSIVEFDMQLLFGVVYQINIDFQNAGGVAGKTAGLWLGNGQYPMIYTDASGAYTDEAGITFEKVAGKDGWWHIRLDMSQAGFDKDAFTESSASFMRIICSLSPVLPEGTLLAHIDNICVNEKTGDDEPTEPELKPGEIANSAVSGSGGTVTVVTDETCDSGDALKLTQGDAMTPYPLYWIDIRTLSADGITSLDLTNAVLTFDVKFAFNGPLGAVNMDFMDYPDNHPSKTASLWLGNGTEPVVSPDSDTINAKGVTFEKVEGKEGWWHIEIDISQAEFDKGDFAESSTAFMRIIASCATAPEVGTDLLWIDNIMISGI